MKTALLLFTLILASCHSAEAQQPDKIAKVGWLRFSRRPVGSRPGGATEVIPRELRQFGYVEGKNIAFEYRSADGNFDRLPAMAAELVRLKVDVIVTSSTPEAIAAKNASATIPIVIISAGDFVAAGLVDSLARPGGNITGFSTIAAALGGKQLELLKETIPKLSRVAVLWDPQAGSGLQWKESQLPARELGLQLYSMQVTSADKYDGAFTEAIKARSDALVVTQSSSIAANQKQIVHLAAKHRLPAIYPRDDFVAAGGLMSYGADQAESNKRIAFLIAKILRDANPADLPIEQPTKFDLVINLKTAKQIDLTIPPNVLARADRIIK